MRCSQNIDQLKQAMAIIVGSAAVAKAQLSVSLSRGNTQAIAQHSHRIGDLHRRGVIIAKRLQALTER